MRPWPHRHRVLSVGTGEFIADLGTQLRQRQLELEETTRSDHDWGPIRALVIAPSPGDMAPVQENAAGLIVPALQHGAKVVIVARLEDVDQLTAWKKCSGYGQVVQIVASSFESFKIAESIARHDPGPPFGPTVELQGAQSLSAEEQVLVRRAFYDCERVTLERLPQGNTANVYRGFALVKASVVGPRPLPFFLKFGRRSKIASERRHYVDCVVNYIPFYLRPNLDDTRFAEGCERALLVGNLVEHSESLFEAVKRGVGPAVLSSLFDNSLRGWRLQAYYLDTSVTTMPLALSMKGAVHGATKQRRLDQIDRRIQLAAERHGTTLDRVAMAKLLEGLPARPHRVCFSHGDLHGDNVLVRGVDAILIDFASVDSGPLVSDLASLDLSLGFSDFGLPIADWMHLADRLYCLESLVSIPLPRNETEILNRLWNSIRHIRRLAASEVMHTDEYATAIAVHMLRRLGLPKGSADEEAKRVYGFSLAEKIVIGLSGRANNSDAAVALPTASNRA